jgi:SAM-dependent methyltransferase
MTLAPVWHDIECGYYSADLQLWEELSQEGDSVLELGCGTGRVTMHLAHGGRKVTGLDTDKRFLEVLEVRAAQCGLAVNTVCADARGFDLGIQFDAVFAPMQLVQLFRGSAERKAMLACVARHLCPGGVFAATVMNLEGELLGDEYGPPRPDVREVNEWVFSSLSMAADVVEHGKAIRIDRLRTAESPEGEQYTTVDEVRLELVSPAVLEREAAAAGLDIQKQRTIPSTEHVGSVVVIARLSDHEANETLAVGRSEQDT